MHCTARESPSVFNMCMCTCVMCTCKKNTHTVGFKNIYDTLKKYFVYRPGAIEGVGGAALEPAFTVVDTLEETLHDEIQETAP